MEELLRDKPILAKKWKYTIYIFTGAIVTFSLLFLYIGYHYQFTESIGVLSNLGQFYSGSVGLLLNLATIIGLIIAYLSQRKQINIQQEEIKENTEYNKVQNFEGNFYQLLNLFQSLSNNIQTRDYKGKEVFGVLFSKFLNETFSNNLRIEISQLENLDKKRERINSLVNNFIDSNNYLLAPYIKLLFHIIKLIDSNSAILGKEKTKFYINIVRSQITKNEYLILFYNGISDKAKYNNNEINYKFLIEKYNFFEYLNFAHFQQNKLLDILNLYKRCAYDENEYNKYFPNL